MDEAKVGVEEAGDPRTQIKTFARKLLDTADQLIDEHHWPKEMTPGSIYYQFHAGAPSSSRPEGHVANREGYVLDRAIRSGVILRAHPHDPDALKIDLRSVTELKGDGLARGKLIVDLLKRLGFLLEGEDFDTSPRVTRFMGLSGSRNPDRVTDWMKGTIIENNVIFGELRHPTEPFVADVVLTDLPVVRGGHKAGAMYIRSG